MSKQEIILEKKYYHLKRISTARGYLIFGIIFLAFLVSSSIWYSNVNVNEDEFCKSRLLMYYPEYNFTTFIYDNGCQGEYKVNVDQRDGLRERNIKTITKNYDLISEGALDYVNSDDLAGWLTLISTMIFGSYLWILKKEYLP